MEAEFKETIKDREAQVTQLRHELQELRADFRVLQQEHQNLQQHSSPQGDLRDYDALSEAGSTIRDVTHREILSYACELCGQIFESESAASLHESRCILFGECQEDQGKQRGCGAQKVKLDYEEADLPEEGAARSKLKEGMRTARLEEGGKMALELKDPREEVDRLKQVIDFMRSKGYGMLQAQDSEMRRLEKAVEDRNALIVALQRELAVVRSIMAPTSETCNRCASGDRHHVRVDTASLEIRINQ